MPAELISRKDARARGLKFFFTGVPCKHGHIAERYATHEKCAECERVRRATLKYRRYQKTYRASPKYKATEKNRRASPKYKATERKYRTTQEYKATAKKRRATSKYKVAKKRHDASAKAKAYQKRRQATPKYRAYQKTYDKKRRTTPKYKAARKNYDASTERKAYRKKHTHGRRQATPKWCDLTALAKLYADAASMAQMTGVPFHVDHAYPIKGKLVCGLNVPANACILPGTENLAKHNRVPAALLAWHCPMCDDDFRRWHYVELAR